MTDHQAKRLFLDHAVHRIIAEGGPHPVETCSCYICCAVRHHAAKRARFRACLTAVIGILDGMWSFSFVEAVITQDNKLFIMGVSAAVAVSLIRIIAVVFSLV